MSQRFFSFHILCTFSIDLGLLWIVYHSSCIVQLILLYMYIIWYLSIAMLRLASFKHKRKHFLVHVFFIFWICYSYIYIAVKRRVWNAMTIWSCGCPNLLLNFSTYDLFMVFFWSTWETLFFVLLGRNVEHLITVLATEVVLFSLQQPSTVR